MKQKSSELHKNVELKTVVHPGENCVRKLILHKTRQPENGPFTKIGDIKTNPKIKNYDVIFHTHSTANEFTRK